MAVRVRPRRAWAVLGAVAVVLSWGAVSASSAAADDSQKYCTLDISTGDFSCSAADPTAGGRLARPALDGGTSYVLGRFFDDTDLDSGGGYFTVTAGAPCDTNADVDFTLGTVPSGWNDRVSSFQGFNNCSVRLWKNGGAGGASWGPATVADTVGSLDNQASSMTFY